MVTVQKPKTGKIAIKNTKYTMEHFIDMIWNLFEENLAKSLSFKNEKR